MKRRKVPGSVLWTVEPQAGYIWPSVSSGFASIDSTNRDRDQHI